MTIYHCKDCGNELSEDELWNHDPHNPRHLGGSGCIVALRKHIEQLRADLDELHFEMLG